MAFPLQFGVAPFPPIIAGADCLPAAAWRAVSGIGGAQLALAQVRTIPARFGPV